MLPCCGAFSSMAIAARNENPLMIITSASTTYATGEKKNARSSFVSRVRKMRMGEERRSGRAAEDQSGRAAERQSYRSAAVKTGRTIREDSLMRIIFGVQCLKAEPCFLFRV